MRWITLHFYKRNHPVLCGHVEITKIALYTSSTEEKMPGSEIFFIGLEESFFALETPEEICEMIGAVM